MSIEELRQASRLALHAEMGRPALYYPTGSSGATPEEITVRLHTKMGMIGDVKGTSFAYAEHADQAERLVFLTTQVPSPSRGGLVVLSASEGYWIDVVEDRDGLTVKATVLQASPEELEPFAAPE